MRREDMSEGWWIRAVRKITCFFVFFFFFFNHDRRGWLVCRMKHHLLSSFNGQFRHYISLEANFHRCYNWTLMSAHIPHGSGITWWIVKKWGYHHFTCVNLSILNTNELLSLYDKYQRRTSSDRWWLWNVVEYVFFSAHLGPINTVWPLFESPNDCLQQDNLSRAKS